MEKPVDWVFELLAVLGIGALLSHHLLEPFVGRYSLLYLLVILGYVASILVLTIWIHRCGIRA